MATVETCENVPPEGIEKADMVSDSEEKVEVCKGGGKKAECGDDHDVQRFLMIDRGEDIIKQLQASNRRYKHQIGVLTREMEHLWEVLKTFMLLFGPLLIGIVVIVMAKCTLPRGYHQNIITSLFVGVFAALVAFRYPAFYSAVEQYLSFRDAKDVGDTGGSFSDSEASTDEESTEEKDDDQTNEAGGEPKPDTECFDMLAKPTAVLL